MLGLGIDAIEVVDAARLATLLDDVGPIAVELPVDVTDASGAVVADAGSATLDPAAAAVDPHRPRSGGRGPRPVPAATAVWSGIAASMSGGDACGVSERCPPTSKG